MMKRRFLSRGLLLWVLLFFGLLFLVQKRVYAVGLVSDAVSPEHLYSHYPLSAYQLDFYVDTSWTWLPWNWLDGIGKSVQYALYSITGFFWGLILFVSNATGYLVEQAYKLDFVDLLGQKIGETIQTIAGATSFGLSEGGIYVRMLLLLVFCSGCYFLYLSVIKKQTTKAVGGLLHFVVGFFVTVALLAQAPDLIGRFNDFSKELSMATLDLGSSLIRSETSGTEDGVVLVRENLFSVQVLKPWLILQFGDSDEQVIGKERIDRLLGADPTVENGKVRQDVVKEEIEQLHNVNLTIPKVVDRLSTTFFLLLFTVGISIFVMLMASMMIFSQVLFLIFALFTPLVFVISLLPNQGHLARKIVERLFQALFMRAIITLVMTIAFALSGLFYGLSSEQPFFMVAFLQIVVFAGIWRKMGDITSLFTFQVADAQQAVSRVVQRPLRTTQRGMRRFSRTVLRSVGTQRAVRSALKADRQDAQRGRRVSLRMARVMDAPSRVRDRLVGMRERVRYAPVHARYKMKKVKEKIPNRMKVFRQEYQEQRQRLRSSREQARLRQYMDVTRKSQELRMGKPKKRQKEAYDFRQGAYADREDLRGRLRRLRKDSAR